jgi:hypothetical protein
MQRLTVMTLGAAFLGLCGFAYDTALAQTPASECAPRDVSLYFDKDTTEFNKFSKQLVERVATEVKSCGSREITAEVKSGPERAQALSTAFHDLGVKVILVGPTAITANTESVEDRSVIVRIAEKRTTHIG